MNVEIPIKIKRLRERKFTKKRSPYKKYLNADWRWTDIFKEIEELRHGRNYIKLISKKYNINYDTLKHKYRNYKNNKIDIIDNENRGGSNKKISKIRENELYSYIKTNYIDTNEILNNNIIKEIINEKFKKDEIVVSSWWISNFKKRWNLSTQKVKPSKIAVNIPTKKEEDIFLRECDEYRNKVREKFFF
jgi:hypothetical protein